LKIRFIINPTAGTGEQQGIEVYIAKNFHDYEILYTKEKGDAIKISKDAVEKKVNTVIAVGGDGTVNECLTSLINTDTALGVIPCGSGNGFAYHIGMSKSITKSIKQLKNSHIENIDTCSVNSMAFVNVSGIGFDAHIAKLFSKNKKRGALSYLRLILKELNYKSETYNINFDGIIRSVEAYMISFANTSQYGNNAKISPMSDVKDGLIDFVIVKKFPKWKLPIFLFLLLVGKLHLSKYVEIIQSKMMEITSQNTLIHIDGETYKAKNPITINILEKSLKILQPNEK
tara:strand:- start:542 stop:1402 length:861 start_codon:yes stop_codon:yes gene_type:complete